MEGCIMIHPMNRTKEYLINFSLVLGAVLLTLVFLELMLRAGHWVYRRIDPREEPTSYMRIDEATKARQLIPNTVVQKQFGHSSKVTVRINSLGCRDRESSFEKPENTRRIVAIGDSITFGWGVELEETYVKQLENLLAHHKQANKTYEVVNLGIEDLGLEEELKILKEVGLKFHPDLVLLGFYLNDARPIVGFHDDEELVYGSTFGRLVQSHTWLHRRFVIRYAVDGVEKLLAKFGAIKPVVSKRFRWHDDFIARKWSNDHDAMERLIEQADLDWGLAWKVESWAGVNQYLTEMREITLTYGCPLVVVCFPASVQVEANVLVDEPQQRLVAICKAHSIPFLDLLPMFRQWNEATSESLFFDQCHPTPSAHKKVAEAIAEFLEPMI